MIKVEPLLSFGDLIGSLFFFIIYPKEERSNYVGGMLARK